MPTGEELKSMFGGGATGADLKAALGQQSPPQQAPQQQPMGLEERGREVFGFADYPERGAILPVARDKEGELQFAWPQMAVDVAESVLLPGHAMKGGKVTPEDTVQFTLDAALPAVVKPPARLPTKAAAARKMVETAPSTDDLLAGGGKLLERARQSGVEFSADDYGKFINDIAGINRGKIVPEIHPRTSAAIKSLANDVGQPRDMEDMMIARRIIQQAANTVDPNLADDRRLATQMIERLDDMVNSQLAEDGRKMWQAARKSQTIEGIVEKAKMQASGFENGLRIGFRSLLNSKKGTRGFTEQEVRLMKQIANGDAPTKALRLLGKLSFGTNSGSNFVGGSIGVAGGSAMFGPVGAVAAPMLGHIAQKTAENRTIRSTDLARALAASGGYMPKTQPAMKSALVEALTRAAGPVAASQSEQRNNARQQPR